uniref:Receptor activity modifying protein 2 n=1 Tax=Laticauda laticaudata TaxID=8630 RepID=A0A8C5SSR8_LATLA
VGSEYVYMCVHGCQNSKNRSSRSGKASHKLEHLLSNRPLSEDHLYLYLAYTTNYFVSLTLGHLYRPYSHLRKCLENEADKLDLNYPNSMAEEYIIISHHNYFFNCTLQNQPLQDPPENILLALIMTPICIIPFLVALVVLKSKDGEMQL